MEVKSGLELKQEWKKNHGRTLATAFFSGLFGSR